MVDIPLQIGDGIGNALLQGYHARALRQQTDQFESRKALGPDVQSAIGGDAGALGRVAAVDPDYALKIGPMLDRLEVGKQAVLKRAAEFTTQMGMGVLNAPPDQQASAYAAGMAEAKRQGHDTSNWPQQWNPQAKGWVEYNVNKAVPVKDWFDKRAEMPTPMGGSPAGGGGGVGGGPAAAISGIESGGRYDAVGPPADSKGSRAYGKYQVMDFNIGPWTQEILGKPMTPQEFMANPQAQDAVFNGKFGQYVQKFGSPSAAARAWFAGEGGMNNPGAADVNGTTVAGYERKFNAAGGGNPAPGVPGAVAAPPQVAQGDTPQADGSGTPLPPNAPQPRPPETMSVQEHVKKTRPGWQVVGNNRTGEMAYDKHGRVIVKGPNGEWDAIDIPKAQQPPSGYQPGQNGGLMPIPGGPADPAAARRLNIPPGYQPSPSGEGYAAIPGGPADPEVIRAQTEVRRAASEKAIPQSVTKSMQENLNALKQIDRTLSALSDKPTGVGNYSDYLQRISPQWGGDINNKLINPEGAQLRALIADIGSLKIHDRSGAAVTASETPRLIPFIPSITDDPATIRKKLANFRAVYEQDLQDTSGYYSQDNGFKEYKPATEYLGGGVPPAEPGKPAPKGPAETARDDFNAKKAAPPPTSLKLPPKPNEGGIPTLNSPEEAAKLPSGTRFRTPDGREKVVP